MKKYLQILTIILVSACISSCEMETVKPYSSSELGAPVKEFKVNFEAGEQVFNVYSNGTYTIKLLGKADWVEYPAESEFDKGFTVQYDINTSYPRSATFELCIGSQKDTVYLRQEGLEVAYLTIPNSGVAAKGSESGSYEAVLSTNVAIDEMSLTTVYEDSEEAGWINDIKINKSGNNTTLNFNVKANDSENARKAQICISFVDGWDNIVSATCFVTQMNKDDVVGKQMSFEQVRAIGVVDPGKKITEDIIISGYIVSDKESKNVVENPRKTITYIDYSACEKAAILESEDGKYGFKLQVESAEYNTFNLYDHVSINLNGATLIKYEEPEYYEINGINSWSIVALTSGSAADIPSKQMHIKDLKDSDIYTYVQLQDCELPVRKGSMSPINEGYSIAGNANRSTKAALLMRDINGDDMYIMTNTTCPYRREGKCLPYGSGTMSGIITHELHTSYNYMDNDSGNEDTYGWIGRYQIRHNSLSDFGMEKDFKNGFSELLTEYRFIKADYQKQIYPTYGTNGYLTHSFKYGATSSHGEGTTSIIGAEEFSYLGPIGTNSNYAFGYHAGNVNGLGIFMDNNVEYEEGAEWGTASQGSAYENINKSEAGKGKTPTACRAAWSVWYNWNNSENRPYSYILQFSTIGLNTTQLSLQLGMLNVLRDNGSKGTYSFGPRFWQIQWSTTGNDERDAEWTSLVDEFMVPDTVNWSPATQLWQSPAFKTFNVRLPLDMLNRPSVFIRIRPTRNLVGTPTAFATTPPSNNTMEPSTAINYIAIRYNK